MRRMTVFPHLARASLTLALAVWMPLAAAQSASATPASTASAHAMDMAAMPMADVPMPASASSTDAPASTAMPEMNHAMHAGHAPAAASSSTMSDAPAMDHGAMRGMQSMQHGTGHPLAAGASTTVPGLPAMDHDAMPDMQGMQHGTSDPPAAVSSMPGMDHATHGSDMGGMSMGAMQGGAAPANARSPDYSDGYRPSTMPGMDMVDSAPIGMLLVDQLEAFHGLDGGGQMWELQGWIGHDTDKLWLRSEGERSGGRLEDGDIEALWSHAVATYWDSTLGVRHDLGERPSRNWLAAGVRGLAPYWFDVEATLYLGASGRSAARVRASYDVLFTQRLILQPELEANLYGHRDPARGHGRGLTDVQFGLRLRYEVRREFAPYVGVQFVQRVGATADLARAAGRPVFDRQLVAGLRFWF